MTEDPNHIFTLRAIGDPARDTFKDVHNERFYVPPPQLEVVAAASRESTPQTNVGDEDCEGNGDKEDFGQQLRFTFDQKPKNIERGLVFGSNPKTCDVILGKPKNGTSGSHFRITFDDQGRLVLIDLSTHGTAVSYGGQAWDEKRKNPSNRTQNKPRDESNDFMWILFPEIENKRVTIGHKIDELPNAPVIEFSVEVATHESCKKQHRNLRNAYLDEMRTAVLFSLNIDSHPTTAGQTEPHSPTQRPKQRPIWINREEIGRGEFGTVYRAVDVSTGVIYAAKTFQGNDEGHRERWDNEVALLRKVSHDHIVKFVEHDAERERPRLIMEYLPLGNLAEQNGIRPFTEWETITLLCQGLSALSYLHPENIVHRDLKPQNILVQCREPANFCIKIADFGLARDGSYLKTFCGTWLYAAPEIWKNRPYTAKVQGQFNPKRWYQRLTRLINDWDSDGLLELLKSSMLRMDPHERLSASECLRESAKLREAIIPAQNLELDPGTPTEAMSSSAIIGALWAADEAEIQINLPTLSKLKSAWQPGGDRDPEMAAEDVGTMLDFPTLRTLNSGCRPEDYPETITQIWSPAPCEDYGSKEGGRSQQRIESGVDDDSRAMRSKRQCIEPPGDEHLPQQTPWKRYEDEILLHHPSSGCVQMLVGRNAASMRKSDCWLNATQLIMLAGKNTKERDRIMATLRRRTKVEVVSTQFPSQLWIPYQDGRFLCEFLHLTDTLRPLLEYGLQQGVNFDNRANYWESKFLEVKAGEATVLFRKTDFWINAAHIVKASGCNHGHEMKKIRERGGKFEIIQGASASQGTYVDPLTGLELCKKYGLSGLESILRSALEEHGYREQSQPAATLARQTIRKTDSAELLRSTIQEPEASPSIGIDDAAKLSQVSCFTEANDGSFLPPIKEPLMQQVQPNLYPSSDRIY